MDEKLLFVQTAQRGVLSMTELCRAFGVSRKTGYKWLDRFEAEGAAGLAERSRAPVSHPNAVVGSIEDWITELRRRRPNWGPRKLLAHMHQQSPQTELPSHSTVSRILHRRGLIKVRRRYAKTPPYDGPFSQCTAPNQVWCADFKGWFRTQDRACCYPLTISDAWSRYLIRCEGLRRPNFEKTSLVYRSAFEEFGMPLVIRTDNGTPFASRAPGGLSPLSIWLIKLGIRPERIEPGKPTQNGRHERMHRTLKQETAQPPRRNRLAQQRAFDAFRRDYNETRPHEALGQIPPARKYVASLRPFPMHLEDPAYPDDREPCRVRLDGSFRWCNRTIDLSRVLAGELIAIETTESGGRLWFGPVELGTVNDEGRFRARR